MIQTTQRSGDLRQTAETWTQERQNQTRNWDPPELIQALTALRAGTGLDQLPSELVLALQAQIGNSALLDLTARRAQGWTERPAFQAPGTPLDTEPLTAPAAEPALSPAPDLAALSPLGEGAPLTI